MEFKAVGYFHSHGFDKRLEERHSIRSILKNSMRLKKKTLHLLILRKKMKTQKMNEIQSTIYLETSIINTHWLSKI